jgi:hypothetical protein
VNITGSNWLQHGDLLRLDVKYSGSPPFEYCVQYKQGQYNITGNETCSVKTRTTSNTFPLIHYFSDSDQHTVVVIVENDVVKNVSRATINIYKGNYCIPYVFLSTGWWCIPHETEVCPYYMVYINDMLKSEMNKNNKKLI